MMALASAFQALVAAVLCLFLQLQLGSAFHLPIGPGERVEITLVRNRERQVIVREEVIVKINCSDRRERFIRSQEITDDRNVTIQWLFQQQLSSFNGFSNFSVQLHGGDRVKIVGRFNEIVNINGTSFTTGAVDGSTGIYTCEVCRNRGTPREVCVNSSVPIVGRPFPPDIDEGQPDDLCTSDFVGRVTCKVGTNFCIDLSAPPTSITLSCVQNASAPPTSNPIGIWFINGIQINNAVDGSRLPGVNGTWRVLDRGQRLVFPVDHGPRGNYTCQLTNAGGNDTESSFITDCIPTAQPEPVGPPDIDEGQPDDLCTSDLLGRVTCKVGTNFCIDLSYPPTSITLFCVQNASAPPTSSPIGIWFVNGIQINSAVDGSRLPGVNGTWRVLEQGQRLIIPVDHDPRGNYTCQLTNADGNDTESSFITECTLPEPVEPPVIDVGIPNEECTMRNYSQAYICKVGTEFCIDYRPFFVRDLILQCLSLRPSRGDRITWLHDGRRITENDREFLIAEGGTELHFTYGSIPGRYTCILRNRRGNDTATTTLKQTPPIHFNVSAMGVKGNGCSRLRCRPFYVNACPFPGETILFNCAAGGRNSSTPIIRTPSGPAPATFVVNNCPRSNIDGRYTCFSSNECGLGESSITLQVFDPARIDMDVNIPRSDRRTRRLGAGREEEQVILEPGSRVELYCPVIGIEDPKVAWFKRGYSGLRLVRPGNDTGHVTVNTTKLGGRITAVLSITSITTDDYGMYVCRTNNMAGEDQARIVLAEPGEWWTGPYSQCVRWRNVTCISADGERELPGSNCRGRMPREMQICNRFRFIAERDRDGEDGDGEDGDSGDGDSDGNGDHTSTFFSFMRRACRNGARRGRGMGRRGGMRGGDDDDNDGFGARRGRGMGRRGGMRGGDDDDNDGFGARRGRGMGRCGGMRGGDDDDNDGFGARRGRGMGRRSGMRGGDDDDRNGDRQDGYRGGRSFFGRRGGMRGGGDFDRCDDRNGDQQGRDRRGGRGGRSGGDLDGEDNNGRDGRAGGRRGRRDVLYFFDNMARYGDDFFDFFGMDFFGGRDGRRGDAFAGFLDYFRSDDDDDDDFRDYVCDLVDIFGRRGEGRGTGGGGRDGGGRDGGGRDGDGRDGDGRDGDGRDGDGRDGGGRNERSRDVEEFDRCRPLIIIN